MPPNQNHIRFDSTKLTDLNGSIVSEFGWVDSTPFTSEWRSQFVSQNMGLNRYILGTGLIGWVSWIDKQISRKGSAKPNVFKKKCQVNIVLSRVYWNEWVDILRLLVEWLNRWCHSWLDRVSSFSHFATIELTGINRIIYKPALNTIWIMKEKS